MRTFWILVFSLIIVAVGIFVVKDPVHVIPTLVSPPAAAATAPFAGAFTPVPNTPAMAAQARLLCAAAGDVGWAVAYQRTRTGMTEAETLTLPSPTKSQAERDIFTRIVRIAYWYDADDKLERGKPEETRARVTRVCVREMLEPPEPTPTVSPTPAPAEQKKASRKAAKGKEASPARSNY